MNTFIVLRVTDRTEDPRQAIREVHRAARLNGLEMYVDVDAAAVSEATDGRLPLPHFVEMQ